MVYSMVSKNINYIWCQIFKAFQMQLHSRPFLIWIFYIAISLIAARNSSFFNAKLIYQPDGINFFFADPNFVGYFTFYTYCFFFVFFYIFSLHIFYSLYFSAFFSYINAVIINFIVFFVFYFYLWTLFFIDFDIVNSFSDSYREIFTDTLYNKKDSYVGRPSPFDQSIRSTWELSVYFDQYRGTIFDCTVLLFLFFFSFFIYYNRYSWSFIYSKKLSTKKRFGSISRGILFIFFFYFFSGESFGYFIFSLFFLFILSEFFRICYKSFIFRKFWKSAYIGLN